jgi:hypothetical protein
MGHLVDGVDASVLLELVCVRVMFIYMYIHLHTFIGDYLHIQETGMHALHSMRALS